VQEVRLVARLDIFFTCGTHNWARFLSRAAYLCCTVSIVEEALFARSATLSQRCAQCDGLDRRPESARPKQDAIYQRAA
jgi:hypothetical protein